MEKRLIRNKKLTPTQRAERETRLNQASKKANAVEKLIRQCLKMQPEDQKMLRLPKGVSADDVKVALGDNTAEFKFTTNKKGDTFIKRK